MIQNHYQSQYKTHILVQVGCLLFLDSYRFLGASLDKLVKSMGTFPIMDSFDFNDAMLKQKPVYPYEKFHIMENY